jgi:hypothetical protein
VINCFSSINEEPAEAQPTREAVGPSPKRAKDFFAYLKKINKRSDKNEAELFLDDPSDSMAQLENYPNIQKMYRCVQ